MKKLVLLICTLFSTSIMALENPIVLMKTSMGDITLELNIAKAPKTVENFLMYIKKGTYSNTIFHKTQADFMIVGGAYDESFEEVPSEAPIINEADNGLLNEVGTIAMSRSGVINSATNEFFINTCDNEFLNHTPPTEKSSSYSWGYAVFGKVIKGMDIVTVIANSKTTSKGHFSRGVPVENIIIKSISVVE